jgi:hypothetical protein
MEIIFCQLIFQCLKSRWFHATYIIHVSGLSVSLLKMDLVPMLVLHCLKAGRKLHIWCSWWFQHHISLLCLPDYTPAILVDICMWDPSSKDWNLSPRKMANVFTHSKTFCPHLHSSLCPEQLMWTDCILWASFPMRFQAGWGNRTPWQQARGQEEMQVVDYFPTSTHPTSHWSPAA